MFARYSWQGRDPLDQLENPLYPALGFQQRDIQGRTLAGSWTQILTSTFLNEFRAGFNKDRSNRRSQFNAGQLADQFGLEIPADGRDRLGYPAFSFAGTNPPSIIRDLRQNVLRDIETESISLGDTATLLAGRHSMKIGALYTHNYILDGFSAGANEGSGQFQFNGSFSGNAFSDFLLGLPFRSNAQINTRGGRPLEATASEFAAFVQDDWKVNSHLTLFLGLRYELLGNFTEENDLLINFDPVSGSLIVPNDGIKAFLAPDCADALCRSSPRRSSGCRARWSTPTRTTSARASALPIASARTASTVIRGGTGLFYPTQAAQGIRDALSRSPFRYSITRNNPTYTNAFSTGTLVTAPGFGVNAVDVDLESAEVLQYNITLERELTNTIGVRATYMGSRFTSCSSTATSTRCRPARCRSIRTMRRS